MFELKHLRRLSKNKQSNNNERKYITCRCLVPNTDCISASRHQTILKCFWCLQHPRKPTLVVSLLQKQLLGLKFQSSKRVFCVRFVFVFLFLEISLMQSWMLSKGGRVPVQVSVSFTCHWMLMFSELPNQQTKDSNPVIKWLFLCYICWVPLSHVWWIGTASIKLQILHLPLSETLIVSFSSSNGAEHQSCHG